MTTTSIQTISLPEAAYLLRDQLGPLRNWSDFLTDNIRGRQSLAGLQLLPIAKRRDRSSYRPVYDVAEVLAFIENVRKTVPSAGPAPVKTTALALDPTRHWRINTFDRDGAPVAKTRRSPARLLSTASRLTTY